MIKNSEFQIYKKSKVQESRSHSGQAKAQELTPGVWQKEALDTMGMYGKNEGKFSPVAKQLTLFPMEPVDQTKVSKSVNLDSQDVPVPHWGDFRFYGKDAERLVLPPVSKPESEPGTAGPTHPKDAVSATQGRLLVDGVTQMKEDQFPGRVRYTEGGLYPDGDKNDPQVIKQHKNAPNYRKVPNRSVHGVGQPTKQGFKDVLDHVGGKKKPVVWTNTRAEAVVYINGQPYNLREMASFENLVLKDGASGQEMAALEQKLKQRLIEKKTIQVPVEDPKPNEPKFKTVQVTPDNVQTTEEVVNDLKKDGYNIQYKRIPLADEKSPTPAQLDEIRHWTNQAKAANPDSNPEFVFNCHQGRGRTTTGMVAAGITMDGRTKQLELPFGITLGEDAEGRADRIIDETYHMQNLRETVDETKQKASRHGERAQEFEKKAKLEQDALKKAELEKQAEKARADKKKYELRATDFTQRYATMQKYSEYIDQHGAGTDEPSFDTWMKQEDQVKDLGQKWAAINQHLGLPNRADVAAA